jgi:energy-coupling factor transporter ATP-binding protein EcfA2
MGLRVRSVEAGWFRGFCEPESIALSDSISIFYGPNGSGKSCVIEAVEWALFGEIGRALHAAHRQAYVGHRPVQNPRRPKSSRTFVELHLDRGGSTRKVRRELLDLKRTRLTVDGVEVPSLRSALGIAEEEMLRPVISRHEGRVFLDASPLVRWERIASLLGVEVFGMAKKAVDQQNQSLQRDNALSEAATLAREARDVDLDQLAEKILASPFSVVDVEATILAAASKEGVAARDVAEVEEKLSLLAPAARPSLPLLPSVGAAGAASDVRDRLEELPVPPRTSDEARQAFLKAGMELSDPNSEECPYCGEPTIDAQKRQAIVAEVESLSAAAKREEERKGAESQLRMSLAKLLVDGGNEALFDSCRRAGASPESIGDFEEQLRQVSVKSKALSDAVIAVLDSAGSSSWQAMMDTAERAVGDLSTTVERLSGSESRMRESLPGSPERDLDAERRREAIRRTCREIRQIKRAGSIRAVSNRLLQIASALKAGEREAVRNRLGRISQRVVQIYEKLNPGEKVKPTALEVQDGERNEVKIKGETYGAEINPATTFSDGHLLCLSLALAIPYRGDLNPTWDTLLIDDPLMGIDLGHAERVADLIHELATAGGKQIVVTSYYKGFVRALESQGGAATWEARPYSESGIVLESQGDEIETLAREADLLRLGMSHERRESGRKLREAFELLTDRAARQLDKARAQMRRNATFPERLEKLSQLGIETDLLGRLKTLGERLGEASHAEDTDPSPETLKWCCEQIEGLRGETLKITPTATKATS